MTAESLVRPGMRVFLFHGSAFCIHRRNWRTIRSPWTFPAVSTLSHREKPRRSREPSSSSPNASSSATTLEQQPAFGANHGGTGGRYTRYQGFAHAGRNSALHAPAERPNHSFLLYASYEAFCGIFCHYSPNDQLHQSSCSVTKVSYLKEARSAHFFVQVCEAPRRCKSASAYFALG